MRLKALYKTTVTIWSDYNPTELELSDFAREAECGDAYCSSLGCVLVSEPEKELNSDGMEFFDARNDEDPGLSPNNPDPESTG